jgi:hypothetical protein
MDEQDNSFANRMVAVSNNLGVNDLTNSGAAVRSFPGCIRIAK